ncbi:MAG: trehalose-phosphatase [Acidobacteria bacterium]|nr:trehalose-phosphatase [Acidobacteriota bacterium]
MQRANSELDGLIRAVQEHSTELLLVLVGFDGVLTEYRDNPNEVRLSDGRRRLLERLVHAGAAVGVVSGRRVHDLRARVGVGDELFYIGLHGLEVVGPGFTRIDRETFDHYRDQLREIASITEPTIAEIGGAHLEDKEAAIALHTRQADSVDAVWARLHLLGRAAEITDLQAFRVFRGNHVLELLPNIGHAKAAAIGAIRDLLEQRHGRPVFAVYVGEDVVDDDGYEAIAGRGVAAVVGRRAGQVRYHLDSIDAVEQLVAELVAARETSRSV